MQMISGELLNILDLPATQQGKPALLMEFSVNPETSPFLVTGTRDVLWITRTRGAKVRAAFRDVSDTGALYLQLVRACQKRSVDEQWGSSHPFTSEGVFASLHHLRGYDLTRLEILAHPDTDWKAAGINVTVNKEGVRIALQHPVLDAVWLPLNVAVIVPEDKSYVGFMGILPHSGNQGLVLIHNASRGIAIAGQA